MTRRVRSAILLLSGALLCVLGVLHLAVTPHIARMLKSNVPSEAAEWISPPMLLNHVVVGILLLPLGVLTVYAALPASRGVAWARFTIRVTAVTVASLPPTLFVLMGARYFEATPFVVATGIVSVASLTLLAAAFLPAKPERSIGSSNPS